MRFTVQDVVCARIEQSRYRAYGMAGWKFLRKENTLEGYGISGNAIFSTIRFRPQVFWVVLSAFTQLFTYYFPVLAHSVFYVKDT